MENKTKLNDKCNNYTKEQKSEARRILRNYQTNVKFVQDVEFELRNPWRPTDPNAAFKGNSAVATSPVESEVFRVMNGEKILGKVRLHIRYAERVFAEMTEIERNIFTARYITRDADTIKTRRDLPRWDFIASQLFTSERTVRRIDEQIVNKLCQIMYD